jgi:hypothetical protein
MSNALRNQCGPRLISGLQMERGDEGETKILESAFLNTVNTAIIPHVSPRLPFNAARFPDRGLPSSPALIGQA